jgi:hypothetical protein
LPQVLQRRLQRPGRPRKSLHEAGRRVGRPLGRRGRPAVSGGQLEPRARSPRLRPLGHHPELGRGRGGKRRPAASTPSTSTGRWPTSRATSRPMSCTTARSASCRSSIIAPSSGSPTRCSAATRSRMT